jgi:hypothetical protein
MRYSNTKKRRSLLVSWMRPRTLRCNRTAAASERHSLPQADSETATAYGSARRSALGATTHARSSTVRLGYPDIELVRVKQFDFEAPDVASVRVKAVHDNELAGRH